MLNFRNLAWTIIAAGLTLSASVSFAQQPDIGDQPGKVDVVGADRQQHEVEGARRLAALRRGHGFAQFRQLRVDAALAGGR